MRILDLIWRPDGDIHVDKAVLLTRFQIVFFLFWFLAPRPVLRAEVTLQPQTSGDSLIHVWQTDDGLPQNWVSSITQTPDGYLWIGTRYGGLARFDGVRFAAFNPQNTPELKDVQVEHLSVDETGALWIVMGNESITALRGNSFQLLREPRAEPRLRADAVLSLQSNSVWFAGEQSSLIKLTLGRETNRWEVFGTSMKSPVNSKIFFADQSGDVWYADRDSHLVCFSNGQSRKFPRSAKIPNRVTSLTLDASRHLWVATSRGLVQWSGTAFFDSTPTNGPAPNNIQLITSSGDGGVWTYEPNRIRKCLNGSWVAEIDPNQSQTATPSGPLDFYGDAQGNAWLISYGHGLWHVKSNGSITQLTEKDGLPSVFITCWFQDSEGDVWIGTAGGGIARIRDRIFNVLGPAQGLPGKVVRSVCTDSNNTLWAGTMSGGLAYLEHGEFIPVTMPSIDRAPVENITTSPAHDGGLWVGSSRHGLMRLQTGGVPQAITPQNLSAVRILFEDSRGDLWAGGLADLFCYTKGQLKSFGTDQGFQSSIAIGAIAEDSSGALWIGTGPGDLWRFYQNKFTRFMPPKEWPSVRISALLSDTNGTIWVGTLGGGLLRFRDGQFIRYTMTEGLPDNTITQLLDDNAGHLWAGTYAGIFRTSKADLEAVASHQSKQLPCRVYGHFDGLPALECTSGFEPSCWHSQDGRLWFATVNGVIAVDPERLTANRIPPRVIIEEMLVDGKKRPLPATLNSSSENTRTSTPLKIEPGRHYLQFNYTGINFVAPDEVRFRVKLQGAEQDWQNMVNQRLVGYGPLAPGDYQLMVTACNSDGVWDDKGTSLAFTILPYFWQTLWFKLVSALTLSVGLGLAVAGVLRHRHRLELEQVKRGHEIERERSRIARDLHDDLGTTLTQISMLSALANREQTPPNEIRAIIQKVRTRCREMVIAMDEIVWAVNPKNDSFAELINYSGNFAEEFFRPTSIRCRLDIPDKLLDFPLSSEMRHNLFLAFKEAVNNVAVHSGATQVLIRAEASTQKIVIHIEDNGRGFDTGKGRTQMGNGIANMHRRMEQVGGNAEVHSTPGTETRVLLCLPVKIIDNH